MKKFSGERNMISKGFTLIEVLVASVILFASIAAVTMVYRGAYLSSAKAEQHVTLAGLVPIILANAMQDIRAQGNSLETEITQNGRVWGTKYKWQANLIAFKSAPKRFDPDDGKYITQPAKYKLWQVKLQIDHKSTTQHYEFHELSWTDA